MDCPDDNTLVALIEHALDPASLSELEVHVDSCEHCRNVVAGLATGSGRSFAFGTPGALRKREDALLDTRIHDRYIVRSLLGRGGMGTVYLAHDVSLGRDVAIKLHRAGTGSDRLHREAIAMAKLAHPNVVTVFEVGSVDTRLYVAMELVRGGTLRSWLGESRSWREIVALLVEVGAGLAAAHAAGLVHRDFKPENVLVGEDGRPRVSDFGLAHVGPETTRGVIGPLASVDERMTVTGTVLGTPAYMAPEQFEGTVDARSDQFAFCVVLWESLYGGRPFGGSSMAEIQTAIDRGEIRRPAKTEAPERLRRAIERGLAVDPDARYADMAELLAELRETAAPRFRRRLAYAGAATLAVIAAAVWGGLQLRARSAETACVERGDEVRAILSDEARAAIRSAFTATHEPSAPATADRVLDVLGRYTDLLADRATASCRGTDDPPRVAEARSACLAEHTRNLSAFVGDLRHADAARVQRAPDTAWATYDPAPCDDVVPAIQATPTTAGDARRLENVKALSHAGHYDEAAAVCQPLLAEAHAKGDLAVEIQALLALGQLQIEQSKIDDAAKTFYQLETLAETHGRDLEAAMALGQLANIAGVERHDYPTAHRQIDLAKAKLQRLGGKNLGMNADLLTIEGQILADESRVAEAERTLRRAIELAEQAYGPDNPKVAVIVGTLSQVLRAAGKHPESLEASRRTLAILTQSLGDDHPTAAGAKMNLATALIQVRRYDEARDLLQRAEPVFIRVWGADHPMHAGLLGNLGELEFAQHHFDAALVAYRGALGILERIGGAESAEAAGAHRDIAKTLAAAGRFAEALVDSQRDVAILDKIGKDNPRLPGAAIQLAEIQLALGHPAAALPIAERGLASELAQGTDADRAELAAGRFALARALWDAGGDRARARSLAEQAATGQEDAGKRAEIQDWLKAHSLAQARR